MVVVFVSSRVAWMAGWRARFNRTRDMGWWWWGRTRVREILGGAVRVVGSGCVQYMHVCHQATAAKTATMNTTKRCQKKQVGNPTEQRPKGGQM